MTPAQIDALITSNITDNSNKENTAARVREILYNMNDSYQSATNGAKVYKALISQTGVDAPYEVNLGGSSAQPFVDTIEGVWSYNTNGRFFYTKAGAFPVEDKVNVIIPDRGIQGADVAMAMYWVDANTLELYAGRVGAFASPASFTPTNGVVDTSSIIIEVYP